jgi:long-chain acyl-CoA synthetase
MWLSDDAGSDPVAVIDAHGTQWMRSSVRDLAERFACAALAQGLRYGDVLAIVSPNCAEFLAIYLGGILAGLYVVPVNWHLSARESAFMLQDSKAKLIVAHQRLGTARLAALDSDKAPNSKLVVIGDVAPYCSLQRFATKLDSRTRPDEAVGRLLAYTSATTGRPKAVELPLAGASRALDATIRWHKSLPSSSNGSSTHLCCCALYHPAPLEGAVISLLSGRRVILTDSADPEVLLQTIEKHRVATAFMVPSMFVRLLKLPDEVRDRYSTSSLRMVNHFGGPCPKDVKRKMIDWWGPVIWEGYGATEGQGTLVSSQEWLKRPGTVGRPIEGSAIRILDSNGHELPAGEVGTVYIKHYTGERFSYRGDPERTLQAFRGDFFTVGDLGYLDVDGYLYLCGRSSDLIISSGTNIYAAEIETVLLEHPAVLDCAVIGVPDEISGEVPRAFVELVHKVPRNAATVRELLSFASERLSGSKLPKRIVFVDQVPRSPTGKVYKRRLETDPATGEVP